MAAACDAPYWAVGDAPYWAVGDAAAATAAAVAARVRARPLRTEAKAEAGAEAEAEAEAEAGGHPHASDGIDEARGPRSRTRVSEHHARPLAGGAAEGGEGRAFTCCTCPEPDEQEPQQFPVERVTGHDPDAGTGMKLAGHAWVDD